MRERRAGRGDVVAAAGQQQQGEGEDGGQPAGREGAGSRAARAGVAVQSLHVKYCGFRGG
jgi:hypothetical protein